MATTALRVLFVGAVCIACRLPHRRVAFAWRPLPPCHGPCERRHGSCGQQARSLEGMQRARTRLLRRATASGSCLSGSWYGAALRNWPVLTKALTAGLLAALGDAMAQTVATGSRMLPSLDLIRLTKFAMVNSVVVAPTFHVWYGWLDSALPQPGMRGALLRTVTDQVAFSPLFLFIFLTIVRSLGNIPVSWHPPSFHLWWVASRVNWTVLPVTQLLNFWLVPLPFQVLFSNVVAVGMNAIMSYLTATA